VSVTLDETSESVRVMVSGEGLQVSQPVTLGVRPEHLEFIDTTALVNGPSALPETTVLTRTVSLVEQLGEHSYVHLDQPGGAVLIAKAPGDTRLAQGDRASFRAASRVCHLFTEDGFAAASLESAEHYA
jgi:ABC-type sugar transport systems, ATPase components